MFTPGMTLKDTYRIVKAIGSGGGADVYRGYHLRLRKSVAIKKIRVETINLQNVRAEADILKTLHHPYLPQVYDFVEDGNDIYTVMDFVEGKTIEELLAYGVSLPEEKVVKWGSQLCDALSYLHTHKPPVMHGDIKPSNIIVTPSDDICLIDFNISMLLTAGASSIHGFSGRYMAPELLSGKGRTDSVNGPFSDIYSLGISLYRMAYGAWPVRDQKGAIDFSRCPFSLRNGFEYAIAKATAPNPHDRFQSAAEMKKVLDNLNLYDKGVRRKKAVFRTVLLLIILVPLCVGIVWFLRKDAAKKQQTADYNSYIAGVESDCESGNFDEAEAKYQKAAAIEPNEADTLLAEARIKYGTGDFDSCVTDLKQAIARQSGLLGSAKEGTETWRSEKTLQSEMYQLLGETYFSQENYEDAADALSQALPDTTNSAEVYRDYAIAEARLGNLDQASDILNQAIGQNIDSASIALVKAEIESRQNQSDLAVTDYQEAIRLADNTTLKERAYLGWARVYDSDAKNNQTAAAAMADVLEQAKTALPEWQTMAAIEKLGQAYGYLADLDSDNSVQYRNQAITEYQSLIDAGYTRFYLYNNIAILYQEADEFEAAAAELSKMETLFADDYRVYMREAFLRADQESTKSNTARNYSSFAAAYDQAEKLYKISISNGYADDAQMKMLEKLYGEIKSNGWL